MTSDMLRVNERNPDLFTKIDDIKKCGTHPGTPIPEWMTMRKFDYRAPRFSVHLPVRVTFEDATEAGLCTEISTEGMTLALRRPLSVQTCGEVHVEYQNLNLHLSIQAAHSNSISNGVRFVYGSDEQREKVIRLVGLLTEAHPGQSPILLR